MTTLKFKSNNNFESLGIRNIQTGEYSESTLFPKGTSVELTKGKFPLTNFKDLFKHSKKLHIIGGKQVKLDSFTISCTEGNIGQYGDGNIVVSA
tara:strand:- start:194 stop:475 length:282 start_codon:yes stop_codon:yes gene_type:complete